MTSTLNRRSACRTPSTTRSFVALQDHLVQTALDHNVLCSPLCLGSHYCAWQNSLQSGCSCLLVLFPPICHTASWPSLQITWSFLDPEYCIPFSPAVRCHHRKQFLYRAIYNHRLPGSFPRGGLSCPFAFPQAQQCSRSGASPIKGPVEGMAPPVFRGEGRDFQTDTGWASQKVESQKKCKAGGEAAGSWIRWQNVCPDRDIKWK